MTGSDYRRSQTSYRRRDARLGGLVGVVLIVALLVTIGVVLVSALGSLGDQLFTTP